MSLLCLHLEPGSTLHSLTILLPDNAELRVASYWNLDASILRLVKEGIVSEFWLNVDSGRLLDQDLVTSVMPALQV